MIVYVGIYYPEDCEEQSHSWRMSIKHFTSKRGGAHEGSQKKLTRKVRQDLRLSYRVTKDL